MRIAIFLFALCGLALAAEKPAWDNPAIVRIGTKELQARPGERAKSPLFCSLDGTWNFHGSLRPAERPLDFHSTDYTDSSWETIPWAQDNVTAVNP